MQYTDSSNSKSLIVFDWDASEDTSRDINPLYANRHQAQFFGRGLRAGIDAKEQRSHQDYYETKELQESDKRSEKSAEEERHWSDKPLVNMKERDWRILKEDFSISTKGGNVPPPLRFWKEAKICEQLLGVIDEVGYTTPSSIQRQAIPIGLENRDIIGIAQTGSGKTAAFLIPMLEGILKKPKMDETNAGDGPYALILAPTRELANQIEVETQKFCEPLGFRSVSIIGGHKIGDQAFQLRDGCEIIIATPGRLRDCLDRHILVLNQCCFVVMDEADKMIDLGFEVDLNYILDSIPSERKRQTVMFSATMPPPLENLAKKYLEKPVIVTIGVAGQAVAEIDQRVEMVSHDRKRGRLLEIVQAFGRPIIVFVGLKKSCDGVAKALVGAGHTCAVLHGGKGQDAREAALAQFKDGRAGILVATDVAGRGIDVKDVCLVVNYDMAKNIEAYTHRIGRTGRAGKSGTAITFLSSGDEEVYFDLRATLQRAGSRIPNELANHPAALRRIGGVREMEFK